MKCALHTNKDAVAQCEQCGAGICEDCAQATAPLRDSCGSLCIDCYCNEIQGAVDYYTKRKKQRLTRIIVSIILYICGVVLYVCSRFSDSLLTSWLMILAALLLCGLFTGISWAKFSRKSQDDYDREHGATYVITDTGVHRDRGWGVVIIFFLIGLFFGVIVTPIRVIIDGVGIKKDKRTINELYADMNSVRQI
ncbi:MAG: MFS transporter [Clostridia bacterium]|nr:MFS transporter [Clostridia bacterium]